MKRLWNALYAKVRAYLLGGTAAAGVSGAILWMVHEAVEVPPSWVDGFVPAAAALLVGLFVAYQKNETGPALIGGQAELVNEADEDLLPVSELGRP